MIGHWTLAELARLAGGELLGADVVFQGISTDSRRLRPGDLFIALRGARFDGHHFLDQAGRGGAVAALVESASPQNLSMPQVRVSDTLKALGALGQGNRQRFSGPVAAITGSHGKTTVKEMLTEICQQRGRTCATHGNLNNHIGVPLSLCELRDEHAYGVFELGANHAGEIAYTVQLVRPQVALLNNAGDAHLEGFGSRDGVARAKAEIFETLSPQGVAILNADSPYLDFWKDRTGHCQRLTFGLSERADVTASRVTPLQNHQIFTLHVRSQSQTVELPLPGQHNICNALAAAAAAAALGIKIEDIAVGLAAVEGVRGRLRRLPGLGGAQIIDDSYNASPASVCAALDVLAGQAGERILVLGMMAELGEYANAAHREVGAYARERADRAFFSGPFAQACCEGFGSGAQVCTDHSAIIDALKPQLHPGQVILVKGSRSAAMENVVNGLLAASEGESD